MRKPSGAGQLDPAAVCRSSDPMAVREPLTKIVDKWTMFLVLSLDLLGGRARFSDVRLPGFHSECRGRLGQGKLGAG